MRNMRSRRVILGELIDFLKEHNRDFKLTYETKLLEAIFELLLDMRDLELRPMIATVGLKCVLCGAELHTVREKSIGMCESCIESLSTSNEGE